MSRIPGMLWRTASSPRRSCSWRSQGGAEGRDRGPARPWIFSGQAGQGESQKTPAESPKNRRICRLTAIFPCRIIVLETGRDRIVAQVLHPRPHARRLKIAVKALVCRTSIIADSSKISLIYLPDTFSASISTAIFLSSISCFLSQIPLKIFSAAFIRAHFPLK